MANDDVTNSPLPGPDGDERIAGPLPRRDTPFSEPDGIVPTDEDRLDSTHPCTDTNLQVEEEYDEGLSGAAEASEPNAHDAVIGYDPTKDQRNNKHA